MITRDDARRNNVLSIMTFFLIISYPLVDIGIPLMASFVGLLIIWLTLLISYKIPFYITNIKCIYLTLTLGIIVLSLFSIVMEDTYSHISYSPIVFIIWSLFIFTIRTNVAEIQIIAKALLIYGVFIALYVIFARLFPEIYSAYILPHLSSMAWADRQMYLMEMGYGIPIGGTIVYGDLILALCSSVILGIVVFDKKYGHKNVLYGMLVLYIIGILMEGRRGELLAYIVSLFVILIITINLINCRKFRLKIFIYALIILCMFAFGISFLSDYDYLKRYLMTYEGWQRGADVSSHRLFLWKIAWGQFLDNPIWGIGWGRCSYLFHQALMAVNNVHNTYLQLLCETGVIGTLIILFPMVYLYYISFSQIRKLSRMNNKTPSGIYIAATISLFMQTYYFIIHFLDPQFYGILFSLVYAICTALTDYSVRAIKCLPDA